MAEAVEKSNRAMQFDALVDSGDGKSLPRELTDGIMADYPYFIPAMVAAVRRCGDYGKDEKDKIVELAAANMADRRALCDLVGPEAGKFRNFYPDEKTCRIRSTIDAISHFLDTFGNNDEAEIKALEQKIFNPVPDYAQLLEKEERESVPVGEELDEAKTSGRDLLINRFIALSKRQDGHFPNAGDEAQSDVSDVVGAPSPKMSEEQTDGSLLSESLAKIYIRQHRYEKALEIIVSLSLNFPEKSIYFADQIRFLRKIIVNEKYKNKK